MAIKKTKLQKIQKLHSEVYEKTREIDKIIGDIADKNFKNRILLCYHSHYYNLTFSVFTSLDYGSEKSQIIFNREGEHTLETQPGKNSIGTEKINQILTALSKPEKE